MGRHLIEYDKGIANGVATLDGTGNVPVGQLGAVGVRNNYVLVKAKSDLPTPVTGVITLANNTTYEINGTIALGTDRIVTGTSNIIVGKDKSDDILSYTGTGAAITVSNNDFSLSKVTVVAGTAGAKCIDMGGSGTNRIEISECIFANSDEVGTITGGFATIVFRNNLIAGNADGLAVSGTNDDMFITDNIFESFTGTPTLLAINGTPATYHTVIITNNMFETAASQTALNISSSLTITDGGIIAANSFEGAGTFLTGIKADNPNWKIAPQSNVGIPGLLFITPQEIVDSTYSTTSSTMAQVPLNVPYFRFEDYQDNATEMTASYNAEVNHDQSGQTLAIDCYNVTDGVAMGFGSNGKLDVDTIAWQSGNTIRYTFNGTPDLSTAKVGDFMTVESATNASNNGQFVITAVNDGSDWIEITNTARTDATDDEASDSPATAYGGSVVYKTITTGGTYEVVTTPLFHLDESKEYRARMRRVTTSGGNPSVLIRNGSQYGVIRAKNF